MKRLALIAVLALTACGFEPRGLYTCPDAELALWSFDLEPTPYDCKTAITNSNMARGIIMGADESPGDPVLELLEVPIFVSRFTVVGDDHNTTFDPVEGITLSCDGRGLAHAWAHQWMHERKGRAPDDDHVGWPFWAITTTDKFERAVRIALPCE